MVETSWRRVVAGLAARRSPTAEQQQLAEQLGMELDPKWHSAVAAASLRRHLGPAVGYHPSPTGAGTLAYALDLAAPLRIKIPREHQDDGELIDAWIQALHDLRAERRLKALHPGVGDIVNVVAGSFAPDELPIAEIASFSSDGQLNFVGGRGARARPHRVEIVARVGEAGYDDARRSAANSVARRRGKLAWLNDTHRDELAEYRVWTQPGLAAINALRDALDAAVDEAPIQRVLEEFPELLSILFTDNHGAWVIPRPSLHGKYVPDFLVATQSSGGVRWWLVELESPTHQIHMNNGHLAKGPRQGINQIEDWRNHILANQANINLPRAAGGLGLPGISHDAPGLVLVGRGTLTSQIDTARLTEATHKNIEIRTYDWLLRARRHVAGIGALDAERPDDDSDWF